MFKIPCTQSINTRCWCLVIYIAVVHTQAKHDLFLNEKSTLEDKVDEQEDRIADLQDSYETGKWELQKAKTREQK